MILELNDVLTSRESLHAEVCVVGAGAAGIAIALELERAGVSVLLLEAGGERREESVHDAYNGGVVNTALHPPLSEYRERRLGGTTTLWGGRCVPFDSIDFETRPWMAMSGWPISSDDLQPFYPRANALAEAGVFDYSACTAFDQPLQPMIAGFEGASFTTTTMERFSCPTDFGIRYRQRLAASRLIRLVLHADVANVEVRQDGAEVTALDVCTASGATRPVTANEYVLAMGGLETTRLLLASRDVHHDGIGNAHGMLGRYYMAHLAGTVGHFRPGGGSSAIFNGYDVADDGSYTRRRLAVRPAIQREQRIGNCIARLHHTRIGDPAHGSGVLSALRLGRAAVPKKFSSRLQDDGTSATDMLRHASNVVLDAPAIARFAWGMAVKRRFAARKYPSVVVRPRSGVYSLDFHSEQEPNRSSRVTLGAEKDASGMPRLQVDWRYSPMDVKTVATFMELFAADVKRAGVGTFAYAPDEVEGEMIRYGAYGGHHLGTTRMSADPQNGVVNADCRVHGVANLHIAGGSVFATSSQANPTLTMLALALRLADRLRVRTAAAPVEVSA